MGRGLLHFNINIVYSKVFQALEISGPKVVLLCKFSLYREPGPEASASPASWMIRLCLLFTGREGVT